MNLFRVWHQEAYQGTHRKKGYFEGWYLKLIDEPRKAVFALIPGVSIGRTKRHSTPHWTAFPPSICWRRPTLPSRWMPCVPFSTAPCTGAFGVSSS